MNNTVCVYCLLFSPCSRGILLGFINFRKDSTASKSTFASGWPSIAISISLEIEVDRILLRRQSLIYFMSLNKQTTVDISKTLWRIKSRYWNFAS